MKSISRYAEYHDSPLGSFASEKSPSLKSVHQWTKAITWMGNDITEFCGGERIQVFLCYPRALHSPAKNIEDSVPNPKPATTSNPYPSQATPLESSDTPDTTAHDARPKLTSLLIAVVGVARLSVDTIQQAQELLLRQYGEGPYPLERHWEKIADRLDLPEAAKIPRLYQIWDSDVGAAPHSEQGVGIWLQQQQDLCSGGKRDLIYGLGWRLLTR